MAIYMNDHPFDWILYRMAMTTNVGDYYHLDDYMVRKTCYCEGITEEVLIARLKERSHIEVVPSAQKGIVLKKICEVNSV